MKCLSLAQVYQCLLSHDKLVMTHLSTVQALHPYLNKYGLMPLDHQSDFIPALPPVTSNDQVEFSGQNG